MAGKYDILIKRARRRCSSPTSGSEWAGAYSRFFLAVPAVLASARVGDVGPPPSAAGQAYLAAVDAASDLMGQRLVCSVLVSLNRRLC